MPEKLANVLAEVQVPVPVKQLVKVPKVNLPVKAAVLVQVLKADRFLSSKDSLREDLKTSTAKNI